MICPFSKLANISETWSAQIQPVEKAHSSRLMPTFATAFAMRSMNSFRAFPARRRMS